MARTIRASRGGIIYHVLNRGNGKQKVFHDSEDYRVFLKGVESSGINVPMRILSYCLMPNHFHLVLWPKRDGDLSRWMQRLMSKQIGFYRAKYSSVGHIWQGRFKAFPCQNGHHLLRVIRYVERNALQANLVSRAEDWKWSSAYWRPRSNGPVKLTKPPVFHSSNWFEYLNQPQPEDELKLLRECVNKDRPWGSKRWVEVTAEELGLSSSFRNRGRPLKLGESMDIPIYGLGKGGKKIRMTPIMGETASFDGEGVRTYNAASP